MREIEFRAWNKATNEMNNYVEIYCYKDGSTGYSAGLDNNSPIGNTDNFHLMQYTGCNDNDGIKIFEGDIIEGCYGPGEVIFQDGKFKYVFSLDVDDLWLYNDCKVIGNIYENPKLIK